MTSLASFTKLYTREESMLTCSNVSEKATAMLELVTLVTTPEHWSRSAWVVRSSTMSPEVMLCAARSAPCWPRLTRVTTSRPYSPVAWPPTTSLCTATPASHSSRRLTLDRSSRASSTSASLSRESSSFCSATNFSIL